MTGWLKLHRELMDKPIWESSTAAQHSILITLLMMANHKEKEWEFNGKKYKAEPGQFVTSLEAIRKKSGKDVSIQNVRTALVRFEKLEFLTSQSTNRNRLITILNWASYQRKDDNEDIEKTTTQQATQQATNKQLTTNKNVRKKEEVIKTISPKVAPSDVDFENAHMLYELMQKNVASPKPNFTNWANDFRILRDKYNHADNFVKRVIQWSQDTNCFMHKNIRSAQSFKKKYETLYLDTVDQVKKENKKVLTIHKKQEDYDELIERLKKEQEQGAIEE